MLNFDFVTQNGSKSPPCRSSPPLTPQSTDASAANEAYDRNSSSPDPSDAVSERAPLLAVNLKPF